MKKLIVMTTVPLSLATLVKGQPKYLSRYFDVKLITSSSDINDEISLYEGVELKSIDMTRKITIFQDLKALYQIFVYLRKEKPDIVYTFTPKAGLLGMMGAFFARIPIRIHNIVGMPLMEARGNKARLLKFVERLTYRFSTKLLCNSMGLKGYIKQNLTKQELSVVGYGSINGVDTEFFNNNFDKKQQNEIREKFHIDEGDFVLTFVGRIVKDKGVNELIEAFVLLRKEHPNLKLLLVGDYEEDLNPIKQENRKLINELNEIIFVGFQKDIRQYLAISDLFVLPSYREGLPNSLIEAGSFGIPLVATDINGCNEIIIDKQTGILVEKKDTKSLKRGINKLLNDRMLYDDIKLNIRDSMIERYDQKFFLEQLKVEIESTI